MPLTFTTGTTPPMIIGNCTRPEAFSSSGFRGMSEAPKVTVLRLDLLDTAAGPDRLVVEAGAVCVLYASAHLE